MGNEHKKMPARTGGEYMVGLPSLVPLPSLVGYRELLRQCRRVVGRNFEATGLAKPAGVYPPCHLPVSGD